MYCGNKTNKCKLSGLLRILIIQNKGMQTSIPRDKVKGSGAAISTGYPMKFRKQREAITKGKIFFRCGDAPRDATHHNGIPCLQTWEGCQKDTYSRDFVILNHFPGKPNALNCKRVEGFWFPHWTGSAVRRSCENRI